jgi:hypothetical protein
MGLRSQIHALAFVLVAFCFIPVSTGGKATPR